MKSLIISQIVDALKLGHEYQLSISRPPFCNMSEVRLVYLRGRKPLYCTGRVDYKLSVHLGHLCAVVLKLKKNIDYIVGRPKKFLRGMDHITKHIGGHPLEDTLMF